MVAQPLLTAILHAMQKHGLEAIMIGNAAAALHGAPVTTLDFDFMFRDTPVNMRKLKAVSRELGAIILRPYYPVSKHPVSKLYRMVDDAHSMQVDFMPVIHGVRSFESLRSRATRKEIGTASAMLASLRDIITSKKSASRAQDLAVLPVLEKTLHEQEAQQGLGEEPEVYAKRATRRAKRRK
jgi:hypothetical protein